MNQPADFDFVEGGMPIADLADQPGKVRALRTRMFVSFLETMQSIFKDHWNPREHGVMKKIFDSQWEAVGPEGIRTRTAQLYTIASGAMHNDDIKNPPAYFTKCAQELLK